MDSWVQEQFAKGAFTQRALLVWAMLAVSCIMVVVCVLAFRFANSENIVAVVASLLGPVSLMMAIISGAFNKWGNNQNV